jgi:hypothetical protein
VEPAEPLQEQHARAAQLPMMPAPTTITSNRLGRRSPWDAAIAD